MMRFILVWLICFLCASGNDGAAARPGHGGTASTASICATKTVDGNCLVGVAAGGLYYPAGTPGTAAGVAHVQQSGQSWVIDSDFNRAGIEYGTGPNLTDVAMTNATTLTSGQVTGCGAYVSATRSWQCAYTGGSGLLTINADVYSKDTQFTILGDGAQHVVFKNFTFETGPNYCLLNTGAALVTIGGANPDFEFQNYKFIEGPECSTAAELWGTPAAAGAGLVQSASFTGTFQAGNGANPGILIIAPGSTTGTIYRKSFVDWPGRFIGTCCTPPFTEINEVLWIMTPTNGGWTGLAHTVGSSTTLVIESTDATSPNANPGANNWLSWNSTAIGARQGNFVTSCNTGAGTCALSGAINLPAGTPVAIGNRSCTGSGCDNAVLQMQLPKSGIGPVAMTTGPIHDNNPVPFTIGSQSCKGFTSRFGLILQMGYQLISKANCGIDVQSDYIEMQAGSIGYADLPAGSSGVPHIDDIIQQTSNGSTSTIPVIQRQFSTNWTSKWNFHGDLSCIICDYTNSPFASGYGTTHTSDNINENLVVANAEINNFYDDGNFSLVGTGPIIRYLGQGLNGTISTITGSVSDNGDGTGTLHIASTTGTVAVNQYILCSGSGCSVAPTGPMQITAQITTQGSDLSTWTTSYFHALAGTVTLGLYPGHIVTNNWSNMVVDLSGTTGGSISQDATVIVDHPSCTNIKNAVTGGTIC